MNLYITTTFLPRPSVIALQEFAIVSNFLTCSLCVKCNFHQQHLQDYHTDHWETQLDSFDCLEQILNSTFLLSSQDEVSFQFFCGAVNKNLNHGTRYISPDQEQ